jgi:uncharacterized protein
MDSATGLGVGLGYRREIAEYFTSKARDIDFFEFIGDTCFDENILEEVTNLSCTMPCVCHTLGLSLGTAENLDEAYLDKLANVLFHTRPRWMSDHLAVTSVGGVHLGHLSPVIFSYETVRYMTRKINSVQERFGMKLLLENITCNFMIPGAELSEPEMLSALVDSTGCGILLDLNNLYINAHNIGYDAEEYLRHFPVENVEQIHIGGANSHGGLLVDSHGHPVAPKIFEYLGLVTERKSNVAVLLERDQNFEHFEELTDDMQRARAILTKQPMTLDRSRNVMR